MPKTNKLVVATLVVMAINSTTICESAEAFPQGVAASGCSDVNIVLNQLPPVLADESILAEMEDGTPLIGNNADKLFNPASNMKILTALFALKKLGADYMFEGQGLPAKTLDRLGGQPANLVTVLHVMLCYSDNYIAEELGRQLGGPAALKKFLVEQEGLDGATLKVVSTSGLGKNRITARTLLKVIRLLAAEADAQSLRLQDLLPVAGESPGTIQARFAQSALRGSFVAKTGTLYKTDRGASALSGIAHTDKGTVYFVIMHRHGSPTNFRPRQDELLLSLVTQLGGPLPDFLPAQAPPPPPPRCGTED